jgi:hypothetical protein
MLQWRFVVLQRQLDGVQLHGEDFVFAFVSTTHINKTVSRHLAVVESSGSIGRIELFAMTVFNSESDSTFSTS